MGSERKSKEKEEDKRNNKKKRSSFDDSEGPIHFLSLNIPSFFIFYNPIAVCVFIVCCCYLFCSSEAFFRFYDSKDEGKTKRPRSVKDEETKEQ